MKVEEYSFRDMVNQIVYIEDVPSKVIQEEFTCEDTITGYIAYAYIDHDAGFTFEILACANKEEDQIVIYEANDQVTFKTRMRYVMNKDMLLLDTIDITPYKAKIENLEKLYNGDVEIKALRDIDAFDHLRSNEFPDDVLVIMNQEGKKQERCWIRLEGVSENYIQGRLLHDPSQKLEVKEGDIVNMVIMQDEDDSIHLVCML